VAALLGIGLGACGTDSVVSHSNAAPVISGMALSPSSLEWGASVDLAVTASDADGDVLTYTFSRGTCDGSLAGSAEGMPQAASSVTFTLGRPAGACQLQVTVADGRGHTTDGAVTLAVQPPTVVYDGIPAVTPPSLTSESLQGNRIDELGEAVTPAGSARKAFEATIVMVTYGPTPAYAWPITLNLYDPADLTHPFATWTKEFDIPARPPADPACGAGSTRWMADGGTCYSGYAFPVTFELGGLTLPDSFVYGITYDTQSVGQHPTGVEGNYNNLNVGLVSTPSTGTVYLNAQNSYPIKGTGVTGSFGPDTNWPYRLPVRFLAY
jgi:hypothetical protein